MSIVVHSFPIVVFIRCTISPNLLHRQSDFLPTGLIEHLLFIYHFLKMS